MADQMLRQQTIGLARARRQVERAKARAEVIERQKAMLAKAMGKDLKELGLDWNPVEGRTLSEDEFRRMQATMRQVAREHTKGQRAARGEAREAAKTPEERQADRETRIRAKNAVRREWQSMKNSGIKMTPEEEDRMDIARPEEQLAILKEIRAAVDADPKRQQAMIRAEQKKATGANIRAAVEQPKSERAQDNAMKRAVQEALSKGSLKPEQMATNVSRDLTPEQQTAKKKATSEKRARSIASKKEAAAAKDAEIQTRQHEARQAGADYGMEPQDFEAMAKQVAVEIHSPEDEAYNQEWAGLVKSSGLTPEKIDEIENDTEGDDHAGIEREDTHKKGDAALHVNDKLMTEWPAMYPNLGLPENVNQQDIIDAIKRGQRARPQWYDPQVVAETTGRLERAKPQQEPAWHFNAAGEWTDQPDVPQGAEEEPIPFRKVGNRERYERLRKWVASKYAKDAAGHEHAPAGSPEGGQFTSGTMGFDPILASMPMTGKPEDRSTASQSHVRTSEEAGHIETEMKSAGQRTKYKVARESANQTFIVELDNGRKAIFKPSSGEKPGLRKDIPAGSYATRALVAYEVAKIGGMEDLVPVTISTQIGEDSGSFQEFVDEAKEALDMTTAEARDGETDAVRSIVYDLIIGNTDRHLGNWMLQGGKIQLIDNDLSFPEAHRDQTYSGIIHKNHLAVLWNTAPFGPAKAAWKGKLAKIKKVAAAAGLSAEAIKRLEKRYNIVMRSENYEEAKKALFRIME